MMEFILGLFSRRFSFGPFRNADPLRAAAGHSALPLPPPPPPGPSEFPGAGGLGSAGWANHPTSSLT